MISESICGLSEAIQSKILKVFSENSSIKEVVLYGSRAKGHFKTGSDIDLTIKSDAISHETLLRLENDLDDLMLPYKIDLSLYHEIENPNLIDHIERVGLVFYRRCP